MGCAFNKEIMTRQANPAELKYQEPKPACPWVCWERQRTQSPASGEVYARKIPVSLEQLSDCTTAAALLHHFFRMQMLREQSSLSEQSTRPECWAEHSGTSACVPIASSAHQWGLGVLLETRQEEKVLFLINYWDWMSKPWYFILTSQHVPMLFTEA